MQLAAGGYLSAGAVAGWRGYMPAGTSTGWLAGWLLAGWQKTLPASGYPAIASCSYNLLYSAFLAATSWLAGYQPSAFYFILFSISADHLLSSL